MIGAQKQAGTADPC
jgi:hypothetical protein